MACAVPLRVDASAPASRDRRPRRLPAASTGGANVLPPSTRSRRLRSSVRRRRARSTARRSRDRGSAPGVKRDARRHLAAEPRLAGDRVRPAPARRTCAPPSRLTARNTSVLPSAVAPHATATNEPVAATHGVRSPARHRRATTDVGRRRRRAAAAPSASSHRNERRVRQHAPACQTAQRLRIIATVRLRTSRARRTGTTRGSPTAVIWLNVGDGLVGYAPAPKFVLRVSDVARGWSG